MKLTLALCVLLVAGAALAEKFSFYEGHKVYRLRVTPAQLPAVAALEGSQGVDFWSSHVAVGRDVDVMVAPERQAEFESLLAVLGVQSTVIVNNARLVFDAEKMRQAEAVARPSGKISFDAYHRHAEINAYLDELEASYSNKVSTEVIGQSYEGRDLKVIKISTNPGANNPILWVDAGIHAREWIAPAQALYVIQELVENSANAALLDGVDWHILPVLNPDGYEFTHTNTRLWRKTRSVVSTSSCIGTDPNRNFGHHWSEGGTSSSPCSDIFHGPNAFSEVEAVALRDYLEANKARIPLYLTLHSYGEDFLYPWSYTTTLPDNWQDLEDLAHAANDAQVAAGGNSYGIGESTVLYGPTAGSSDDWSMGGTGIPMAYTIELPGGGPNGFDLPASQITRVVVPFFEAFRVFGEFVKTA